MRDEHEEPYIELPELNKENIEDNAENIAYNRRLIYIFFVCIIVINSFAIGLLYHDISGCEEKLYKKLTTKGYESSLFREK